MRSIPKSAAAVVAALVLAVTSATPSVAHGPDPKHHDQATLPVVIAHRGASGYRPEHTIAAYQLAIKQCADYIEPDLVVTRDGILVDRHEPEIGGTTDVSSRPEFANRKTTKQLDGKPVTGWFAEDFTLAELKTLRAVERLPELRPDNTAYNGLYQVPTFEEVLKLAVKTKACSGKRLGVIPEIKHSTYFRHQGFDMERKTVAMLKKFGLTSHRDPVVIQSFEVSNLVRLSWMTRVRLVQLVDCQGGPYDATANGIPLTYAKMSTAKGLKAISLYADQVSFCKDVMIPRQADGSLGTPTRVIRDAHRAGLVVVGWTFRRENNFLPLEFRSSDNPADPGDLVGEIQVFLDAGMDQFFTDNPDLGVAAVKEWNG
ncbi:glycerophosphodiester phosphodiesterase [Tessaracoccus antarcticus]|uniref:glycerophosphodiester phosphodiesterase n=1 Tax=Tessaracoccus antarcticus TaxID=2479848 RepID=A0A3M0G443_9ACTN|nr:glycerophosphodiester phosphodiesterase [Tessaracoccus antarcticus]RMB59674.1 glycerophosphodiester phosphodiesterase [Tessaracoccus antarcticus]